jgi:hypothetical protein
MRSFCAFACLAFLAGCSVEQGGRILQPVPNGVVQVYLLPDGSPLKTGPAKPALVHGGFSLNVTEAWYTNYFTATVVSYTAPTANPCIVAPKKPNNSVLTFTYSRQLSLKDNRNACYPGNGDVEGIRVVDVYGNSSTQYFENK